MATRSEAMLPTFLRTTLLSLGMIVVVLTTVHAGRPEPSRVPAILTTDIGAEVDDQWMLAHLAMAPEIELRGVVTTHAPSLPAPAAERAADVARDVLAHLPRDGHRSWPPVLAGSSVALADGQHPRPSAGVTFLIAEARRHAVSQRGAARPTRLAVLVTGAATDVASALLLAPDIADAIDVVAMAFDDPVRGGDSWNVRNDVAAWQVLLASRLPITIGDAAVTKRDLAMTRARAARLLGTRSVDSTAGRYLVRELARWLDRDPPFIRSITGSPDTWIIWDEVVVAHLLGMTHETARPRPVLHDDLTFAPPNASTATVTWVTAIDKDQVWRHFARSLKR